MFELLAPAKNYECGKAAVDAGADALYIGGPFSARAAAANSLEEIAALVDYAHRYWVKVYVALNTLLNDQEIAAAQELIFKLYELGVDALIIQDMGILELTLPPLPLFASTQCDNRSLEKVQFLEKCGLQRVILARELTLAEIRAIRAQTTVALEVFIHGALCVCYSGQCYMSFANGGRSANRGVCAQPCRKKYKLYDSAGEFLGEDYYLSLKDLNLSDHLADLIEAGVTSFKIEGRLKDKAYVLNVVGYYRQKLDELLKKKGLSRSSQGETKLNFVPDPAKSFNRGRTTYNLTGKRDDLLAHTSKSVGEKIGVITELRNAWARIPGHKLNTGDGVCYFINGELLGTQIVAVDGDAVELNILDELSEGLVVYRNYDRLFEKQLADKAAVRKVSLRFKYDQGVCTYIDPTGLKVSVELSGEPPQNMAKAQETITEQFAKLGDTEFVVASSEWSGAPLFVPVKQLNQLRRDLVQKLQQLRKAQYPRAEYLLMPTSHVYPQKKLDYQGNVHNKYAEAFYLRHGVTELAPAAESVGYLSTGDTVMQTKHCLREVFGRCPDQDKQPWKLCDAEGNTFSVLFDCKACAMRLIRG